MKSGTSDAIIFILDIPLEMFYICFYCDIIPNSNREYNYLWGESTMKDEPANMEFHEVEERLRVAGIQPTAQRIAICQYVLNQKDHASVDEVKEWVDHKIPKVSLATVYNTLNLLVKHGLIKAIKLPQSDRVHYDCNTNVHGHFYDEESSELIDLTSDQIKVICNLGDDFEVDDIQVLINGKRK